MEKLKLNIIFSKIYILLITIIIILDVIQCQMKLPLSIYLKNKRDNIDNYDAIKFFDDNYELLFYTELKVGESRHRIPAMIKSTEYGFCVFEKRCDIISVVNISKSSSFKRKMKNNFIYKGIKGITLANEIFYILGKGINMDIIYSYSWLEPNKTNLKNYTCATIGLQLTDHYSMNNFVMQLKANKTLNDYSFSIQYPKYNIFNKSQEDIGYLFLGNESHNINKTGIPAQINYLNILMWDIKFDNVYSKINNNMQTQFKNTHVSLLFDTGLIIASNEYQNFIENKFFNDFYKINICHKTKNNDAFEIITCEANKNFYIKNYPTIYLKSKALNYIFELNYNDLFKLIGNTYYFLIVFNNEKKFCLSSKKGIFLNDIKNINKSHDDLDDIVFEDISGFKFGKPFLDKYKFSFDYDSKMIYFDNDYSYDKIHNDKNNKNKKFLYKFRSNTIVKLIIILILLILIFILLLILKKKHLVKNDRKLKFNEINDDTEYLFNSKEQ